MIRVVRPAEPDAVSKALNRRRPPDDKTELELAREYYGRIPPPTKAYSFSVYKNLAVCRALDELFHDKCAYCESRYRAVDSRDIEHFRPKGGVTEAPKHTGYWWLAAAWKNLLPSCPPCNQLRHQTIFDSGMSLEEFEKARRKRPVRTSGKANSFPVRNDLWVSTEAEDIKTEDPLLINPCERDPADHLEFFFDWDRKTYIWEADPVAALVRPRSRDGEDDPYGKASIGIYGLNRAGLVRERAARVRDMQLLCRPVVDLARDLGGSPSESDLRRIGLRLEQYKVNLAELAQPDQPYTGMARAFLLQFEKDLERLAGDMD